MHQEIKVYTIFHRACLTSQRIIPFLCAFTEGL